MCDEKNSFFTKCSDNKILEYLFCHVILHGAQRLIQKVNVPKGTKL